LFPVQFQKIIVVKIHGSPSQNKAVKGEKEKRRNTEPETKLGKSISKKNKYKKISRQHNKPGQKNERQKCIFFVFHL
jgi:hypothetical protein